MTSDIAKALTLVAERLDKLEAWSHEPYDFTHLIARLDALESARSAGAEKPCAMEGCDETDDECSTGCRYLKTPETAPGPAVPERAVGDEVSAGAVGSKDAVNDQLTNSGRAEDPRPSPTPAPSPSPISCDHENGAAPPAQSVEHPPRRTIDWESVEQAVRDQVGDWDDTITDACEAAIRADRLSASRPAVLVPAGWVLVPTEPTDAMAEAWAKLAVDRLRRRMKDDNDCSGVVEGAKESYRTMINAAPRFPVETDGRTDDEVTEEIWHQIGLNASRREKP